MSNLFKKTTPREEQRKTDRAMRQTNRSLEKDRRQLEQQEKQLEAEIRKMAKQGNKEACGTLAKQLVRLRQQKTKSVGMSAKVSSINSQTKMMHSNVRMADAMKSTTKTMGEVNKQMDPVKLAQTMGEFEKANAQMDMGQEIMDDALDSALTESGDEEEEQKVMDQIFDEIGIDIKAKLSKAPVPSSRVGEATAQPSSKLTDADLEKMLAQLKD